MTIKEQVIHTIDCLNETELHKVADYLSFLRFRSCVQRNIFIDEKTLAQVYAEFSSEDCELAEAGIEDYHHSLLSEDEK